MTILSVIAAVLLYAPAVVIAHGNENHSSDGVSITGIVDAEPSEQQIPDALDAIGGPFSLMDHNGQVVTDRTFVGKHTLVFFGYVDCQVMCSISLGRIGEALAVLRQKEETMLDRLVPLVVTVDPENDTPDKLRSALQKYDPALLGLTGSKDELEKMYKAYNQNPTPLEESFNGEKVVSHSSYFYLMGPDGEFRTLFPPVLNPESMASILQKYVGVSQER